VNRERLRDRQAVREQPSGIGGSGERDQQDEDWGTHGDGVLREFRAIEAGESDG
jgi:hypothetical protein